MERRENHTIFAPFKSRTPGTTVTVASSRTWRSWRR